MAEYRVTYFNTSSVVFDIEDLKDRFPDEWDLSDGSEEEFIQTVVYEHGFTELTEQDFLVEVEELSGQIEVEKI